MKKMQAPGLSIKEEWSYQNYQNVTDEIRGGGGSVSEVLYLLMCWCLTVSHLHKPVTLPPKMGSTNTT